MPTSDAIMAALCSDSVEDQAGNPANVVDVLHQAGLTLRSVASAITPVDAPAGKDATGGSVGSLTEAVMGLTAGAMHIADAINNVAEAIQASNPSSPCG